MMKNERRKIRKLKRAQHANDTLRATLAHTYTPARFHVSQRECENDKYAKMFRALLFDHERKQAMH